MDLPRTNGLIIGRIGTMHDKMTNG